MTLTLILVRHAKSDHPVGTDDHDRPLNDRGRRDAPRMGAWMAERGHVPERVLCSTATRAAETWEGLQAGGIDAPVEYDRALYHAAPDTMIGLLEGQPERSVMILGHNPGISMVAGHLARSEPEGSGFATYPTCAVTVLRFPVGDWSEVAPGTGEVVDFAAPRDLDG